MADPQGPFMFGGRLHRRLDAMMGVPPVPRPEPLMAAAEKVAKDLFLSSLRPHEREQWDETATITITGSDRRKYTLCAHPAYNVLDHETQRGLCALPLGVPVFDQLLAQKLVLETNAKAFRDICGHGQWPGWQISSNPQRLRAYTASPQRLRGHIASQ